MIAAASWAPAIHTIGPSAVRRWVLLAVASAVLAGYLSCAFWLLTAQLTRHMASVDSTFVPSDLYVPWLGAKALVAGQNPYSAAFAEQLHVVFYGRIVTQSAEMQNIAAFAYPPFVVALLLPLLWLPFEIVRWVSVAALGACVAATAALWLRLVRPGASRLALAGTALGSLLFMPAIQLLWLQQPSGLVLFLVVAAAVLTSRGRFALAGVLLAIAMLKPQLAGLPAAALLGWSLWSRLRWPLPVAFTLTLGALLVLSEALLPGWLGEFRAVTDRYRASNTIFWMPSTLLGQSTGAALAAGLLVVLAYQWWRLRGIRFGSQPTVHLFSLTCACAVVLMPDVSFYNRTLLLLPIVSVLGGDVRQTILARTTHRLAVIGVAAPVALMAAAAPVIWLGAGGTLLQALLSSAEASLLVMPLLIAPTLLARIVVSKP